MNILQINSSARSENSQSSRLAGAIVERLRAADPEARVSVRDLSRSPHPALDEAALGALFTPTAQRTPQQAGRVAQDDALIAELSAAVGLGGRDRRLGDERERARKAVTARIHDAIGRIDRALPELGEHLRTTVQTGTWCTYSPEQPIRWRGAR